MFKLYLIKMTSETVDDVEPIVLKWLSDADAETLTKVCAEVPLTIPSNKAGKRFLIIVEVFVL